METLLVKVSERKKANMLVELLKSMDFIESVDYIGDLKSFKEAFNNVNEEASSTDLKEMTMDDINNEIKQYRLEKRAGKLSDKYGGILSKEDGGKLNEHIKQMRGE
jgi:hypothetical protein